MSDIGSTHRRSKEPEFGPDGREINPWIPKFIINSPWYTEGAERDSVDKQNSVQSTFPHLQAAKKTVEPTWYTQRGVSSKPTASKYRKGACTNCGSMSHQTRDCLEKPRKVGAKYTGKNIQADEKVEEIVTTWDSKRDRWNGYDADEYSKVVQKFYAQGGTADMYEKQLAEGKLGSGYRATELEDPEALQVAINLRDRHDTAEYLKDIGSSHTREAATDPKVDDEVVKHKQYIQELERIRVEKHKSETAVQDRNLLPEATPTGTALLVKRQRQDENDDSPRSDKRRTLVAMYGGEDYLNPIPEEVLPVTRATQSSKYKEDVYPGNHRSIWGSYWFRNKWGYQCCHSLTKESYCVGLEGRQVNDEANEN